LTLDDETKCSFLYVQVVHCCLDGIVPPGQTTNWDNTVISQLKQLVPKTGESSAFYYANVVKTTDHLTIVKLRNDAGKY